jgi:CHAT domain/Tetratricopeptide repeat
MKQRLLAQVQARLERFGADQNPATVLDPEAVAELTALLGTVPDPAADLEIARVAGWLHWYRYLVLDPGDDQQDLDDALAFFLPVYHARPDAVPDQVRAYFGLPAASDEPQALAERAVTLVQEALGTGDRAALNAAIDLLRQAVAAIPAGDLRRAGYLVNLSIALQVRFEWAGDQTDLGDAIDAGEQMVAATPADDPDRARYLSVLSTALQARFEQAGNPADLDTAIDLLQQAVAASPMDRGATLSDLGIALKARFQRGGDLADLDAAIDLLRRGAASRMDGPGRATTLSVLGGALQARFERTGDLADLDGAIEAGEQAVAAIPADRPSRAEYLSNLGIALQARFDQAGDQADLDAAIDLLQQAVAATPAERPARPRYLSNLGIALRARFERTGDLADLDGAIEAAEQAVAASLADRPTRALYLSNLCAALQVRSGRTGELADLDAAIDAGRQAVAASPVGHPARPMYLSNLGTALQDRFQRTRELADLDAAVDLLRQAVAAIPADLPARPVYLSHLGAALQARFDQAGDQADLDAAVDLFREAAAAPPADPRSRPMFLSDLGWALRARFVRTGDQADLDAAVGLFRQALAGTLADHPDHAVYLADLGSALWTRFDRAGDPADLDAAVGLSRQAAGMEVASPQVRAAAALGWWGAAADGRRWQEAVAGFAAGAELLGLVAPRSLPRGDQEHSLKAMGSLGAAAAACCVHAGLTDRAVELFEQGRGVLLGQALDTRTDLTALAERHPGLAARFTVLRDDLDRSGDPNRPPATTLSATGGTAEGRTEEARRDAERRRSAAAAFDQVIAEIRLLPDFRDFLRPPRLPELLTAAEEGPVVIIAVSRFGSYGLIVTSSGVLDTVPLTELTPQAVYDRVVDFVGAVNDAWSPAVGASGRAAAEQRLADTLGWLWDALAGPVLDRLGITGPPRDGRPWPRLWWCVSGLLSFLPVHAAGHHRTRADAAPATVIDRVISSYTPTIRALAYARRPSSDVAEDAGHRPGAGHRVVAVAMPCTPGASDLPGAQAEAAGLQQRFPGRVTVLTGPHATRDAVLAALPAGRWAHFACHGASDLANPSASRLLLTDHQQRPLTVVDVARLRLDGAGLAFLSACSTAQPGSRLADEAIHLASAFQLAGYRHVIATLWPVGDQHAVDLAANVYTRLTATGDGDVAGAVHGAVRRMRRLWGWDAPSVWASHIHTGA